MKNRYTFIIAGGKTGGHLFPGIAVAEELRTLGHRVVFAGSKGGLEERVVPEEGYKLELIKVEGIKGRGIAAKLRSFLRIPYAVLQSVGVVRRYEADAVISLGGFAAGPVSLAGKILGKSIFAMEQNSAPGVTTKAVSRFAKRVYVSFPETVSLFGDKSVHTGNPVRREFKNPGKMDIETEKPVLAIFGGSQGAASLNSLVRYTFSKYPDLLDAFHIVHQTGGREYDAMAEFYEKCGAECTVLPFMKDVAACYNRADVMLCRAGATTIAELKALGKPAIFLPFPGATDNHQYKNAMQVAGSGGGAVIEDAGSESVKGRKLYSLLDGIRKGTVTFSAEKEKRDASRLIVEDMMKNLGA